MAKQVKEKEVPQEIRIKIFAYCANEHQHKEISTLLKTLCHTLDVALEAKHPLNDFTFVVENAHRDSETKTDVPVHGARSIIGL